MNIIDEDAKILYPADFIAKMFGISLRRIQGLTQEGILPTVKEPGKKRGYELLSTVQKYIEYLKPKGGDEAKKLNPLDQAEYDLKQLKIKTAQLKLDELEGRLHCAEDVESMTTDLILSIRSSLLALPGRLAVDVANINSASEAANRIREEVLKVLEDFSRYRYDPQEYARRVRDREGMREVDDDPTAK